MPLDYAKLMYNMSDDDLERFVADWVAAAVGIYIGGHERFSGAGDRGRDVVGYLSEQRLDGSWHNYQCKQYKRNLDKGSFLLELGKILLYSAQGHFSLPQRFYFVAPRGVSRTVQTYESTPSMLRKAIVDEWDECCAKRIEKGAEHSLDDRLISVIASFNFSCVEVLDAAKLAKLPQIKPIFVKWFGEDPGPYPLREVPHNIQPEEETYIDHLIAAYSEHKDIPFLSADFVLADKEHGPHLRDQRTRYFEADTFMRYYRDNTPKGTVEDFKNDVYHGIIDEHRGFHRDALQRVNQVMKHAALLPVTGVLSRYAKNSVKQGTCHHLVNQGDLSWKP